MTQNERRDEPPERGDERTEAAAPEPQPGPERAWEGYSPETLAALLDG
jgi:hypothetical protein